MSCSDGIPLPLEAQAGDLVVVLSTIDGRATPQIFVHDPGAVLRVRSDDERPIYTWLLPRAEQVDPSGQPIDAGKLAGATVRLAPDPLDAIANTGSCERCIAPTLSSPIVTHPGDSCPLPGFSPGAVWQPEQDYACRGAAGGELCAQGSAEDLAAIEQARRLIRIDRPGICVCSGAPKSPSLSGLEIVPFSPRQSTVPMTAFAYNDAGEIAGFGNTGAFMHRPGEPSSLTLFSKIEWTVTAAIGLKSGEFLVTGMGFNTGPFPEQVFYRFNAAADGTLEYELTDVRSPARPRSMKYLGDTNDQYPLYLIGSTRTIFGSDPAIFACAEDGQNCQEVTTTQCRVRPALHPLQNALVTNDGFGLGVAHTALYYKTPGEPGLPKLSTRDTWRCAQPEGPFMALRPEDPDVDLQTFETIGVSGDRLFVCGPLTVGACEPQQAVVLTATSTRGEPNWRVAYVGGAHSRCGDFIDHPEGIAVALAGGKLVKFGQAGEVTSEAHITETFGPVPGLYKVLQLSPGRVLAQTSHNRVWVGTSSQAFAPIFGASSLPYRVYRTAVARPEGGFIAFGNADGPVLVDALGLSATELPDPSGELSGAQIYAASTTADRSQDGLQIILGGDKEGSPYLIRAEMNTDGLQDIVHIEIPANVGRVIDIADLGSRALIATLDTRLFILKGQNLQEVDINWDDPLTDAVERRPQAPEDRCTGNIGRLNLLKSVFGSEGVGWAAGDNLLLQISPGANGPRAERYNLPTGTDSTAGLAMCSAQTTMAARTNVLDGGGTTITRLKMFELQTEDEPRRGDTAPMALDPRRKRFTPISVLDFETLTDPNLRLGLAVSVLPDQGNFGDATQALVLHNGFIMRVGSGLQRVEYLRVPFWPRFAVQDGAGTVLFGGAEGQLAVGAPVIDGSGR